MVKVITGDITTTADGEVALEVKVSYTQPNVDMPEVSDDWLWIGEVSSYTDLTGVVYVYELDVYNNYDFSTRTGQVTFKSYDNGGSWESVVLTITQDGISMYPKNTDEVYYGPIWKDVVYEFVNDTEYGIYTEQTYRAPGNHIIKTDVLIFSGKVYMPPQGDRVLLMVNKICQNYFEDNYLPFDSGSVGITNNFNMYKLKDGNGKLLRTYYFVNDWSYKDMRVGLKTNPIIPKIVEGQRLFFSIMGANETFGVNYRVDYKDEQPYTNGDTARNRLYTSLILTSRAEGVVNFNLNGVDYPAIARCNAPYVLYYCNPYGGWDWFPIMGKVTKTDAIDTYTYTKNYSNTTSEFGRYRYLTEIKTTYRLTTNFLKQEQSDRMWELIESNCVYLHDLVEDKIHPVLITNTEVEHKKKTRQQKLISYEIIAETSQTRERI